MPKKSAALSLKNYVVKISVGNLKDVGLIKIDAFNKKDAEMLTVKFLKVKASLNEII